MHAGALGRTFSRAPKPHMQHSLGSWFTIMTAAPLPWSHEQVEQSGPPGSPARWTSLGPATPDLERRIRTARAAPGTLVQVDGCQLDSTAAQQGTYRCMSVARVTVLNAFSGWRPMTGRLRAVVTSVGFQGSQECRSLSQPEEVRQCALRSTTRRLLRPVATIQAAWCHEVQV